MNIDETELTPAYGGYWANNWWVQIPVLSDAGFNRSLTPVIARRYPTHVAFSAIYPMIDIAVSDLREVFAKFQQMESQFRECHSLYS